mgnify:CR=1 FL=1
MMRRWLLRLLELFNFGKKRYYGGEAQGRPVQPADPEDSRDWTFKASVDGLTESVTKISLAPFVSSIKYQGSIGSCGPHAITSAYELLLNRECFDEYFQCS